MRGTTDRTTIQKQSSSVPFQEDPPSLSEKIKITRESRLRTSYGSSTSCVSKESRTEDVTYIRGRCPRTHTCQRGRGPRTSRVAGVVVRGTHTVEGVVNVSIGVMSRRSLKHRVTESVWWKRVVGSPIYSYAPS